MSTSTTFFSLNSTVKDLGDKIVNDYSKLLEVSFESKSYLYSIGNGAF